MDDRIRKRILVFYFAGFLNLVLGFYVLLNGRTLVDQGMWYLLLAFFFGFAAVDFWFARNLKKKWVEAQARLDAGKASVEGGIKS
jgi:hypothetical protein